MSKDCNKNFKTPFVCGEDIFQEFELIADGQERNIWESFIPVKGTLIVVYDPFSPNITFPPSQITIERFNQDSVDRTLKPGDIISITSLGLKKILLTPPTVAETSIEFTIRICIQEECDPCRQCR